MPQETAYQLGKACWTRARLVGGSPWEAAQLVAMVGLVRFTRLFTWTSRATVVSLDDYQVSLL